VDEIGFSVYLSAVNDPSGLTRLRETVEAVRERFDVPVFLAEFGFPAAPMTTGPFVEWSHPLRNYALTEDGQAALLRDLASWGATGPLSGIRPWAPEVFREDSAWGPMALFRQSSPFLGEARPSLDALREGVAAPDPGALQE
jgi:hypothetical protein